VSEAARTVTNQGFGRVLVVLYAIFAIGATSRSVIQVSTRFDEAPIAYSLSTFAAIVYVVATIALARGHETSRRVAYVAISIEMAGVLVVGAASVLFPDAFPRASVWSYFGMGYLFIPLVLPIVGLWWLRRSTSAPSSGSTA
jgi:surface polysaccharide O-acyltransferase-like enzyme